MAAVKVEEKSEVNKILERYLEKNRLETTFQWCIEKVIIPEPPSCSLLEALGILFSKGPEHSPQHMIDFTRYMMLQRNPHCVELLCNILETLVNTSVIPARLVCEGLLSQLNSSNLLAWQKGLSLINKIIGGVDYKGCREIMKLILDKFDALPHSIEEKLVPMLHSGRKLLSYILNRDASLMPVYMAHDEIQLRYPTPEARFHWALKDVIASLKGTMEMVAGLVSGNMLPYLIPVVSCSNTTGNAWKLNPEHSCFSLPGRLPYAQKLLQSQDDLVYKVLGQPQSKDMIIGMLCLGKTPHIHTVLEKAMVRLLYEALKATDQWSLTDTATIQTWSHITNQFFVMSLIQVINSSKIFTELKDKVQGLQFLKGRSYLMWLILYYLSGSNKDTSIQTEYDVIMSLINALYTETEPLPIPQDNCEFVYQLSAAGLWMTLMKKMDDTSTEVPVALKRHVQYLHDQLESLSSDPNPSPYTITALLNSFYSNTESCNNILSIITSNGFHHPLPITCINLLVFQAKMKLAEKIKHQLWKASDTSKQLDSMTVATGLFETFSRVLLWVGTKTFQSQLIPFVFKLQDWCMIQNLLEVISYRIHSQLPMSSRFQILILLHSIAGVVIIPSQLFIEAENTALHLIVGLTDSEMLPLQLVKSPTDPKALFHPESDELNKTLLYTLAQSLALSRVDLGPWLENLLKEIESVIFQWPETSLSFLPPILRQFCHTPSHETLKVSLLSRVEDEYKKLNTKSENDLQAHYTDSDASTYILCILWKQLFTTGQITPLVARLLQRLRLSPKKQASVLRTMIDYIVYTTPGTGSNDFMHVVSCLNSLVWKYFLYPLDRLLLCVLWRCYNAVDSVTGLMLVYHLLMSDCITERLEHFHNNVPHWSDANWKEKHDEYLSQYPECFTFDTSGTSTVSAPMDMLFGNVCLRLLPIIDLTIQRMLEVPKTYQSLLESLLSKYKVLYKFHKAPVDFLYRTLHYFSSSLVEFPNVKQNLVSSILGSLPEEQVTHEMKFSELFKNVVIRRTVSLSGPPTEDYWEPLLVHIKNALIPFKDPSIAHLSWPLSEFTNPTSCLLKTGALEVMAFPLPSQQIIKSLTDALIKLYTTKLSYEDSLEILNVAGALLSILPDSFSLLYYEQVSILLSSPSYTTYNNNNNISDNLLLTGEKTPGSCLINLAHSFVHHSNVSVTTGLLNWLQNKVKPVISNEGQLLFICQLLSAMLSRLANEKPTVLLQVVIELYHLIKQVDTAQEGVMNNSAPICDLLYHIKYMHIGDHKRDEIESIVLSLHSPLKLRLRFLVQTSTVSGSGGALTPVMSLSSANTVDNTAGNLMQSS